MTEICFPPSGPGGPRPRCQQGWALEGASAPARWSRPLPVSSHGPPCVWPCPDLLLEGHQPWRSRATPVTSVRLAQRSKGPSTHGHILRSWRLGRQHLPLRDPAQPVNDCAQNPGCGVCCPQTQSCVGLYDWSRRARRRRAPTCPLQTGTCGCRAERPPVTDICAPCVPEASKSPLVKVSTWGPEWRRHLGSPMWVGVRVLAAVTAHACQGTGPARRRI